MGNRSKRFRRFLRFVYKSIIGSSWEPICRMNGMHLGKYRKRAFRNLVGLDRLRFERKRYEIYKKSAYSSKIISRGLGTSWSSENDRSIRGWIPFSRIAIDALLLSILLALSGATSIVDTTKDDWTATEIEQNRCISLDKYALLKPIRVVWWKTIPYSRTPSQSILWYIDFKLKLWYSNFKK
jgi:hypothetical protein